MFPESKIIRYHFCFSYFCPLFIWNIFLKYVYLWVWFWSDIKVFKFAVILNWFRIKWKNSLIVELTGMKYVFLLWTESWQSEQKMGEWHNLRKFALLYSEWIITNEAYLDLLGFFSTTNFGQLFLFANITWLKYCLFNHSPSS